MAIKLTKTHAQRLQKLFWMSTGDLIKYLSSEAADWDNKEFKANYGFTIKQAIDSLEELKKIIIE